VIETGAQSATRNAVLKTLSWPPLPEAAEYRVEISDGEADTSMLRLGPLRAPSCVVELSGPLVDRRLLGTLFWRRHRLARWRQFGPPAPVSFDEDVAWGATGRSPITRLQLYDSSLAEIVADQVTLGKPSAPWHEAELSHRVVGREMSWDGSDWTAPGEWFLPPLGVALGPARPSPPPTPETETPDLLLLFTIDTEGSIERMRHPDPDGMVDLLVFGGEDRLGIDLHMDVLEHFGATGCFFLDILMEYRYGVRGVERIVERILERGHEIQLHVHAADHLAHAADERLRRLAPALGRDDPDLFREVLELAIGRFEHYVGHRPIAYRAGGYRIADCHLEVLAELGIRIDSSAQTWFHARVADWMRPLTQPHRVGGLLEVPATWYLREEGGDLGDARSYAPAPGVGPGHSVTSMPRFGLAPTVATIVSHSFQMLRAEPRSDPRFRDEWIEALSRRLPPDAVSRLAPEEGHRFNVIEPARDDEMIAFAVRELRAVAERPDARVVTFAELDRLAAERGWWQGARSVPADPIPSFDVRGHANVRWQRIYSADLARRCRELPAIESEGAVKPQGENATQSCELSWAGRCADELPSAQDRVRRLLHELPPGQELRVLVDVLGAPAGGSPALGPLLFPLAVLEGYDHAPLALDVPSFTILFNEMGAEVLSVGRYARPLHELALLHEHAARLRGLAAVELRTARAKFVVRPATAASRSPRDGRATPADALWSLAQRCAAAAVGTEVGAETGVLENLKAQGLLAEIRQADAVGVNEAGLLSAVGVFEWLEPTELFARAHWAYELLRPGGEALVQISTSASLTATSVLTALLQAGFETVAIRAGESSMACLMARPFELEDIDRLGGGRILS
jgi:hypothetical protein